MFQQHFEMALYLGSTTPLESLADSLGEDDSSDVILAFINSDEEDAKRYTLRVGHNQETRK